MNDPVAELRDVVRSLTEPQSAKEIAHNIDRWFTEDTYIDHPFLNQPYSAHGKDMMKGYYTWLRVMTGNTKTVFHEVMVNEDRTRAFVELTQNASLRIFGLTLPIKGHVRFLVILRLRKEPDGKFRISHQEDNFPSDVARAGLALIPGSAFFNNVVKAYIAIVAGKIGLFMLSIGWGCP